jgi:hypothetical protein
VPASIVTSRNTPGPKPTPPALPNTSASATTPSTNSASSPCRPHQRSTQGSCQGRPAKGVSAVDADTTWARGSSDRVARTACTRDVRRRQVARATDKVDAACRALDEAGADGCVAVGGGSTVGLAKAVALLTGLPYVAVPTTDAGSEMTPLWGLTDSNRKRTGRDAESTAAHRNLRSRPHLRPSVIGF